MDIQKQERIKKFLADKLMSEVVREVLTNSFLKTDGEKDVQLLAASMLAVEKLEKGFKELTRISRSEEKPDKEIKQVGL